MNFIKNHDVNSYSGENKFYFNSTKSIFMSIVTNISRLICTYFS